MNSLVNHVMIVPPRLEEIARFRMTPGILPVSFGLFRAHVFSYGPNGVICAAAGIAGVAELAAFFREGDDRLGEQRPARRRLTKDGRCG
jgi:hypothetical protein